MSALTFLLEKRVLSKIALAGFLLTLPLSVRKVLFVFPPQGAQGFNEYTDVSLYLSDLTLIAFALLVILENKTRILSILWQKEMFHVEQSSLNHQNVPRGTILNSLNSAVKKCSTWNNFAILVISPLPFLIWSAISIFWSESQTLAFYASIKLFIGYLLYIALLLSIVPRGTIDRNGALNENCSTWNNSHEGNTKEQMFHVEQFSETASVDFGVTENVPRGTFQKSLEWMTRKCSTWNNLELLFKVLIISGFFQSLIAVGQFFAQSSLGMRFLWESEISPQQAGIAKIIYADTALVRGYGLFPHPNLLAAFLGITLILTLSYNLVFKKKLFHVEQFSSNNRIVPRGTIERLWPLYFSSSIKNYLFVRVPRMFHVEQFGIFYPTALFVQALGFLTAFSKIAILSFFITILYLIYRLFHVEQSTKYSENVPRGTIFERVKMFLKNCSTWNNRPNTQKMFHVEQFSLLLKGVFFGVILVLVGTQLNWYYFLYQPFHERISFYEGFFSIFSQYLWQGLGVGQLVLVMQNFSSEKLFDWQFQPIHNIFLMVTAEIGLVGLVFFTLFIWSVAWKLFPVRNVPRGTNTIECSTWNKFYDNKKKKEMFHVEQIQGRAVIVVCKSLGIFVILTAFFDHYYWDIQQGQLLFWLVLGLIASQVVTLSIDKYNK